MSPTKTLTFQVELVLIKTVYFFACAVTKARVLFKEGLFKNLGKEFEAFNRVFVISLLFFAARKFVISERFSGKLSHAWSTVIQLVLVVKVQDTSRVINGLIDRVSEAERSNSWLRLGQKMYL